MHAKTALLLYIALPAVQGGGMAKEAKNWQKGKVQKETFLSAKWALLSLHPLVYNHRAEQQHNCPTSRWPVFSRNALVIQPLASDTRRFYPGSLSFLPFLPCLSLWMPSRHAGSAENSSTAWLEVAVIIKSEVEAEARHGKNPPLSGIVQKRKKRGEGERNECWGAACTKKHGLKISGAEQEHHHQGVPPGYHAVKGIKIPNEQKSKAFRPSTLKHPTGAAFFSNMKHLVARYGLYLFC